jgi:hypothetical protein
MRSSISSSERQTASDRPGVAQPVPQRPVPAQHWGRIVLGAMLLASLLLGAWEMHWRAYGVVAGSYDDPALWAIQRRRIDHGDGDAFARVVAHDAQQRGTLHRRAVSDSAARARYRSGRALVARPGVDVP